MLHIVNVFIALGTQHVMRVRNIVVCDWKAYQNCFTLSHNRQDLKKKGFEHEMSNFFWRFADRASHYIYLSN